MQRLLGRQNSSVQHRAARARHGKCKFQDKGAGITPAPPSTTLPSIHLWTDGQKIPIFYSGTTPFPGFLRHARHTAGSMPSSSSFPTWALTWCGLNSIFKNIIVRGRLRETSPKSLPKIIQRVSNFSFVGFFQFSSCPLHLLGICLEWNPSLAAKSPLDFVTFQAVPKRVNKHRSVEIQPWKTLLEKQRFLLIDLISCSKLA